MAEANLIEQFQANVAQLLSLLNLKATVVVDEQELEGRKYFEVKINTEDNGAELIGHHGSTLDSIAVILGLLIPATEERYSVLLDINGYRDERTKYIEDLTAKAVDQVVNNNQSIVLQPMKPWERRIVHMALAERTDISTESQGEEPDRRVVIKPASVGESANPAESVV